MFYLIAIQSVNSAGRAIDFDLFAQLFEYCRDSADFFGSLCSKRMMVPVMVPAKNTHLKIDSNRSLVVNISHFAIVTVQMVGKNFPIVCSFEFVAKPCHQSGILALALEKNHC